ncbi:MAG: sensor histidine kinase [Nostocoides sp.]
MDTSVVAILSGAVGIAMGAGGILAARRSEHRPEPPTPSLSSGVPAVLSVLSSAAVVLDPSDTVVSASPAASARGLVRGGDLVHDDLRGLVREVRRGPDIVDVELDLPRGVRSQGVLPVRARVAPLDGRHVLLLVDDLTNARQVDAVRRDFIANVSHELKTPVGGLSLLAEAVLDARDDPEAVARFASRMQIEADRLARLISEIVELSRLQTADVGSEPRLLDLGRAVTEAAEHTRVSGDLKGITVSAVADPDLLMFGAHDLIVTAVRNLLMNAVAYSDPNTNVTVSAARAGEFLEVAVIDQGIGIPEEDRARIFERFYRVDAARSRQTGGTGLGLSIVKHVCENHGGSVTVWSREGSGSTFTMRLPAAPVDDEIVSEPHEQGAATT